MALDVKKLGRPADRPVAVVKAEARLWLTADRSELVVDGDRRAAFLFCSPGEEILVSEAERLGLLDPPEPEPEPEPPAESAPVAEPAPKPDASKQQKKAEDKQRKPAASKAAGKSKE